MPKRIRGQVQKIRMTPAFFHILLSLVGEEKHGYSIMQEVAERTHGDIRLGPGSLYWSLNRLQVAGLIEETETRPDSENDDGRRRYYRLTERGSEVLSREAQAWARIVNLAKAKKLIRDPGLV